MKKRVIIFIAVIIITVIGALFINKSFIEDSQDYLKGILETGKPQNISVFVLPAIPILTIISPENITYSTLTILLNYSAKNAETVWYNLDSIENITITSPLYFNISEGPHILHLYAKNSLGESAKSVIFSIKIEISQPPFGGSEGGGGGGGGGAEPLEENITTPQETQKNATGQETPENRTQKPEEKPTSTREITIKFLISLLFLVLLIILVILLIVIIKRKLKKEKQKKKKK